MNRRPLAVSSVVFVIVLALFLFLNDSLFERNPVKNNAEGKKQLEGFLQDTFIQGYGIVSDYEYRKNNKQISTELTLTNVHILAPDEPPPKTRQCLEPASKEQIHSTSKDMVYYNSQDMVYYDSQDMIYYNSKDMIRDNSEDKSYCDSTDMIRNNSEDKSYCDSTDIIHNNFENKGYCISSGDWENAFTQYWKKVTRWGQKIIVYINKEETPLIGETIYFSGTLSFFESAANPGQFDAEKFYKNRDTLFAVKRASLVKQTGKKDVIKQNLKEFADNQEKVLDHFLSDSHASIIKAMLFGNKKELDPEMKALYQDNGIAHILAISGLHISLLGMAVYKLLRRLPVPGWVSLAGSEIFLLLYGCMVGFSASSFRAIAMFTIFLLSKICKRSYDMITAAAFAAILQLLIHPGYLFDCGFQLSYLAIGGIGILLPVFQEWIKLIQIVWIQKAISIVLPSFSVTLLTAPVLIYHYHEISFFSILLNVIVIPFVGILLQTAIVMLFAAKVCLPFAWLCTILVRMILEFYEGACRILELFPIGQKNISHPSVLVIILYYFFLFMMTVLVKKKRNWYQFLFPLLALTLLLFPKNPGFSIWMLDVGQGDCNVIFSEEGKCFVIDCGSTSEYRVGEKRLIPFLKYYGIGKVDAVFVTHADADHINGIVELLECAQEENIKVTQVFVHEQTLYAETESWEQLLSAADAAGVSVVGINQGDCIQSASLKLTCLYPLYEQRGLQGNDSSLVLHLETGAQTHRQEGEEGGERTEAVQTEKSRTEESSTGESRKKETLKEKRRFSALFTGDLEIAGETFLMQEYAGEMAPGITNSDEESRPGKVPGEEWQTGKAGGETESVLTAKKTWIGNCDLLKVGHHGSSGSSSSEFLRWTSPRIACISCGQENPYGHPHEETIKRLRNAGTYIVMTPESGAVRVSTGLRGEIQVQKWRNR